jgi:hypothetical protein
MHEPWALAARPSAACIRRRGGGRGCVCALWCRVITSASEERATLAVPPSPPAPAYNTAASRGARAGCSGARARHARYRWRRACLLARPFRRWPLIVCISTRSAAPNCLSRAHNFRRHLPVILLACRRPVVSFLDAGGQSWTRCCCCCCCCCCYAHLVDLS